MKHWLILFLVFIVAAESLIPCCAIDNCPADEVANAHETEKKDGNCSPFFACASCTSSIELTVADQIFTPESQLPQHQERILKARLSAYSASWWQPPRL